MIARTWKRTMQLGGLALVFAAASPELATAQLSGRGFLFSPPGANLTIRGGYAGAMAGSDFFDFTMEELTLERGDFAGPMVETELGITLHPRFDLVLGTGYTSASASSEYREWEEELPDGSARAIVQQTDFRRVPLSASLQAYLGERGTRYGRHAWVPTRFAPYVGVGGGAVWHRLRQSGDFVDPETSDIFSDDYESSGWAPMAQGFAGVDVTLTPRLALVGEGKYLWAESELDRADFEGFEPLDLSGFSLTAGLKFRF